LFFIPLKLQRCGLVSIIFNGIFIENPQHPCHPINSHILRTRRVKPRENIQANKPGHVHVCVFLWTNEHCTQPHSCTIFTSNIFHIFTPCQLVWFAVLVLGLLAGNWHLIEI